MKDFSYAKHRKNKKLFWIRIKSYECHIIALPILPFVILSDKIHDYQYKRMTWSETKATKVLDYTLPKFLEYVEEDNAYYWNPTWMINFCNYVPFWLKKWAKKFNYDIHTYLKTTYNKEGYIKEFDDEGWIKFTPIA